MRIRVVLAHPTSTVKYEVREVKVSSYLINAGHDVEVYRSHNSPNQPGPDGENPSFARFFPIDDAATSPYESTSSALLAHLEKDEPDVVIVKGLGYRLVCVFRKNGTVVSLNRGQWFH